MRLEEATFDYRTMSYFEDSKKNLNFSQMQSIILIGAYLAGQNKESMDVKLYTQDKSKMRTHNKQHPKDKPVNGRGLPGKSKKFGIERICAIVDYLVSLQAGGCRENLTLNHSVEFYACVSIIDIYLIKVASIINSITFR